jgi:HSP20 family protein
MRTLERYERVGQLGGSTLRLDVREEEERYLLEADLPGVNEKDIKIEVREQHLTISAEPEKPEHKEIYLVRERGNAYYSRRLSLPSDADPQDVEAVYENGVLSIVVGKRPEARPRSIEVKRA